MLSKLSWAEKGFITSETEFKGWYLSNCEYTKIAEIFLSFNNDCPATVVLVIYFPYNKLEDVFPYNKLEDVFWYSKLNYSNGVFNRDFFSSFFLLL